MPRFPEHVKANPYLSNIWNSIKNNDMTELILITGRTGQGKSCFGLLMMLALDIARTVKNQKGFTSRFSLNKCFFNVEPFVNTITKQTEEKKQAFPKGTCFMLDEGNVESSNVTWYDLRSKALSTALQTNRKYNYIIIVTTPDLKSISIQVRRRATCIVQMLKKVKINDMPYAQARIEWLDYNHKTGEPYYKLHRYWKKANVTTNKTKIPIPTYRKIRITSAYIPLIPGNIENEYNKRKDEAMRLWYEKLSSDLEYMRKYLGLGGKETKRYCFEDLKKLFTLEDGRVNTSDIVDEKQQIKKVLVEEKAYEKGIEMSQRDGNKLMQWLRIMNMRQLSQALASKVN